MIGVPIRSTLVEVSWSQRAIDVFDQAVHQVEQLE